MEQRQRDQPAIGFGGRPIALVVSDVPEHPAVGHDGALGTPGRSRGIGLERLGDIGDRRRLNCRTAFRQFLLERLEARLAAAEQQPHAQRHPRCNRQRTAVARGVDDRERTAGAADDLLESIAGKPRIERQGNRPGTHRPEEKFQEFGAVADQHGDALAWPHAEPCQHARHRIHPLIELTVSRAALVPAEQIDDGNLVGQALYRFIEEEAEISPPLVHAHA